MYCECLRRGVELLLDNETKKKIVSIWKYAENLKSFVHFVISDVLSDIMADVPNGSLVLMEINSLKTKRRLLYLTL